MPNLDVNPDFATSFTHYPSLVVHLILKFEEKLILRVNEGQQQAVNVPLVTQPNSVGAQVMNRVPRKCTIEHQGHTQASTFKIVFDYRELPIDPRTVVAARVEIYAGTVSAEDFSEGIQRESSPGVRKSILKTRTPEGRSLDGDLHMLGMVDKWSVDMGAEGSEVHLEGRDLRGLLLDSPLVTPRDMRHRGERHAPASGTTPAAGTHPRSTPRQTSILARLDCTQNIAALVLQILEEHDTIRRLPVPIEVICRAEDFEDGVIPSPGAGANIPRHRRGASGRGSNAGGGAQNMNFWDLITRYSFLVGVIPSFVGRKLYLRPARALFTHIAHEFQDTPFRPNVARSVPNTDKVWGIRKLVFGRDIMSMKITRNYAGHTKPKAVRIVSVDHSAPVRGRAPQRLLEAVYPPRNVREAIREGFTKDPRGALGGQESQEILNVPVYGVRNMAQLVSIAISLYEQIGRGEIKGEVESAGLTSFGGSNADPDLIRLKVGDPIELLVDASALDQRSPIVSTLNRTMQLPFSQAVAEVQQYLRDENLSRAIVASARGNVMGVLSFFRVSNVSLDWSDETMTVKADIQNYWTPRWDYVTDVQQTARRRQANHADARHRPSPSAPPGAPINLGTVSRVGESQVPQSMLDQPLDDSQFGEVRERANRSDRWR